MLKSGLHVYLCKGYFLSLGFSKRVSHDVKLEYLTNYQFLASAQKYVISTQSHHVPEVSTIKFPEEVAKTKRITEIVEKLALFGKWKMVRILRQIGCI